MQQKWSWHFLFLEDNLFSIYIHCWYWKKHGAWCVAARHRAMICSRLLTLVLIDILNSSSSSLLKQEQQTLSWLKCRTYKRGLTVTFLTFGTSSIFSKQSVHNDFLCLLLSYSIMQSLPAFVKSKWMLTGNNNAPAVPPSQVSSLFCTYLAPQTQRVVQSRRLSTNRCDISHNDDISNHGWKAHHASLITTDDEQYIYDIYVYIYLKNNYHKDQHLAKHRQSFELIR